MLNTPLDDLGGGVEELKATSFGVYCEFVQKSMIYQLVSVCNENAVHLREVRILRPECFLVNTSVHANGQATIYGLHA